MKRKERRDSDALAGEILQKIVEMCNEKTDTQAIGFASDWGGNSLTIYMRGGHTHVGMGDTDWPEFVRELHALLINGKGLSIA